MPRLIFSNSDHLNTDISDEQGHKLYTVSTPWAFNKVTTITKYLWNGPTGSPQTLGVIEWHSLTGDVIRFEGHNGSVDMLLEKRAWQSGWHFVGPDKKSYKWKLETNHCWLKPADGHKELVRFHKSNLGILKESHPPYLDIISEVVPILDHIIFTFVYVEKMREEQTRRRHRVAHNSAMTGAMR